VVVPQDGRQREKERTDVGSESRHAAPGGEPE
jgi:hypothetical protein